MASSDTQRRILLYAMVAAAALAALASLPFIEHWLRTDFFSRLGWTFDDTWQLIARDNVSVSVMASTYAALIDHFFRLVKVGLAMALVIAFVRLFLFLIFGRRSENKREISSLLKTVLSIAVYLISFAIIFQAQYPGVNLGSIFAGSAIFGIVVGLALQDTLGNLFAGIALQADQPFQVGDVITLANRGSGVVESVSWRGVKIRTFQNKLVVISNSVLGKESIEVASKGNLNARVVNFSTAYSVSPARTVQVVRDAIRLTENLSPKIRPVVRIKDLGESGVDWEIKYWIEDYTKHNDTDAMIRQRVWYAFQRERIEFSHPSLSVHIEPKPQDAAVEERINAISERLNNVPIFAPLSDEETERLAKLSKIRVYAPGEAIVRMGQEGNSMFVIVRGSVEVQVPQGSTTKVLNTLRENDFFGEMSLLTGEPRTASVVAKEETEVVRITKASMKPIFEANPELVKSVSEMVEERREILRSLVEKQSDPESAEDKGIVRSIRRFFGLR
jgi:small-conductance mechanosensitive channel